MKLMTRLENLSIAGVFALYNDKDKKVYIGTSNCCLLAISQLLKNFKDKVVPIRELYQDRKKLEVSILETIDDKIQRDVRYNYWCDYYRNLGYSLYREHKGTTYTVRLTIENIETEIYRVLVQLVNTRKDKIVVGVFSTVDEAQEFIKLNYEGKDYIVPVYSDNSLTKEYLNKK